MIICKEVEVCSNCFSLVDKCSCEKKNSIMVDRHMQPILKKLNDKGYKTLFSCESHAEINSNYFCMYIMFENPIPIKYRDITDFWFERGGRIVKYLIIDAEKKGLNDLVNEKKTHLDILDEWVDKLHRK